MAVKQWSVGDILTAADMNAWAVPQVALKASDQAITSNAAFFSDASLLVALAASATYEFMAYMIWECAATSAAGIKFAMTVPAGATLHVAGISGNATGINGDVGTGVNINSIQASVANTPLGYNIHGLVIVGSTAGNLQLQWAQATSSASATTLHANSLLRANRIG